VRIELPDVLSGCTQVVRAQVGRNGILRGGYFPVIHRVPDASGRARPKKDSA
jgi:hypothetical protein